MVCTQFHENRLIIDGRNRQKTCATDNCVLDYGSSVALSVSQGVKKKGMKHQMPPSLFFSIDLKPVESKVKQEKITDSMPVKKKRDRFNGMSEEEVMKRTLPDHLCENLDVIIVSINVYPYPVDRDYCRF